MSQTLPASRAQTRASNLTSTNADSPAGHRCTSPAASSAVRTAPAPAPVRRISSASLMGEGRAIEIEHGGRIYQLRITQLNKLILTA